LTRFEGKILYSEDRSGGIETHEGTAAYKDAIEFLKLQPPVPTAMQRAAKDHIDDIGPKGQTSSLGSGNLLILVTKILYIDGSLPTDRLARYCNIDESWAENMCFQCLTPQEVMERLIVSDG
jgi:hypothetical protein